VAKRANPEGKRKTHPPRVYTCHRKGLQETQRKKASVQKRGGLPVPAEGKRQKLSSRPKYKNVGRRSHTNLKGGRITPDCQLKSFQGGAPAAQNDKGKSLVTGKRRKTAEPTKKKSCPYGGRRPPQKKKKGCRRRGPEDQKQRICAAGEVATPNARKLWFGEKTEQLQPGKRGFSVAGSTKRTLRVKFSRGQKGGTPRNFSYTCEKDLGGGKVVHAQTKNCTVRCGRKKKEVAGLLGENFLLRKTPGEKSVKNLCCQRFIPAKAKEKRFQPGTQMKEKISFVTEQIEPTSTAKKNAARNRFTVAAKKKRRLWGKTTREGEGTAARPPTPRKKKESGGPSGSGPGPGKNRMMQGSQERKQAL